MVEDFSRGGFQSRLSRESVFRGSVGTKPREFEVWDRSSLRTRKTEDEEEVEVEDAGC